MNRLLPIGRAFFRRVTFPIWGIHEFWGMPDENGKRMESGEFLSGLLFFITVFISVLLLASGAAPWLVLVKIGLFPYVGGLIYLGKNRYADYLFAGPTFGIFLVTLIAIVFS